MLNEEEFTARLEAALALRREREGREERTGLDHLKVGADLCLWCIDIHVNIHVCAALILWACVVHVVLNMILL